MDTTLITLFVGLLVMAVLFLVINLKASANSLAGLVISWMGFLGLVASLGMMVYLLVVELIKWLK